MKNLLKTLTLCLLASIYLAACDKKEPGPGYYFKFKADGVAYNYEYECDKSPIFSAGCNMGAGQSSSATFDPYFIYGANAPTGSARGEVMFYLNKDDFNNLDTIILDGDRNSVEIYNLTATGNNYLQRGIHFGKIIILEKTTDHIRGGFYFDCEQQYDNTLMLITEGEFFVGRSN